VLNVQDYYDKNINYADTCSEVKVYKVFEEIHTFSAMFEGFCELSHQCQIIV